MTLKVGNGSAFWGDTTFAIHSLASEVDVLTLDYLSEVSMSIMAVQREKDKNLGYAADFLKVLKILEPLLRSEKRLKIISNAGGLNPLGLAHLVKSLGLPLRCFVVLGDDVLNLLQNDAVNANYKNLDTGESFQSVVSQVVTANAYLGAEGVVEALDRGADIVITGRIADPSLTVAPCLHKFNWPKDSYDKYAAATVAGHLIECGTQVTGGIATDWLTLPLDPPIGFPIAEMREDGSFVISKQTGSGGAVTEMTVKEQLLYEIGDPSRYISPDAIVSFLKIQLNEIAKDRVQVSSVVGMPPTDTYKVSATYRAGYKAEGMIALFGSKLKEKAEAAAGLLFNKLKRMGCAYDQTLFELIGAGAIPHKTTGDVKEGILRVAVRGQNKECVEAFAEEIASLVTCGPAGTTGYSSGRPSVRKAFGFWPCLIEKAKIKYEVKEV